MSLPTFWARGHEERLPKIYVIINTGIGLLAIMSSLIMSAHVILQVYTIMYVQPDVLGNLTLL